MPIASAAKPIIFMKLTAMPKTKEVPQQTEKEDQRNNKTASTCSTTTYQLYDELTIPSYNKAIQYNNMNLET